MSGHTDGLKSKKIRAGWDRRDHRAHQGSVHLLFLHLSYPNGLSSH